MDDDQQSLNRTGDEWKEKLTPEQYKVLRQKGTEAPFTGAYHHTQEKGTYHCVGCGSQLFSSDAKFDSGTGWPSFDQALPDAVAYREDHDHGMSRTEVLCAHCGGHLGHVFDDLPRHGSGKAGGPQATTGKRYCINSVCLNLKQSEI